MHSRLMKKTISLREAALLLQRLKSASEKALLQGAKSLKNSNSTERMPISRLIRTLSRKTRKRSNSYRDKGTLNVSLSFFFTERQLLSKHFKPQNLERTINTGFSTYDVI